MEPNKFEKQIKEKLNAREIQPSNQAWDRLDAMLSVAENTKTKKTFPWLKIAAGFVVFVTIVFFFFTQNKDFSEKQNPAGIIVEASNINSGVSNENNESIVASEAFVEVKSTEIKNSSPSNTILKEAEKRNSTTNWKSVLNQSKILSNDNVVEVVSQKTKLELDNKTINNEVFVGVDEKQIVSTEKTSLDKPKLKVDPSTLLNQVEGEVELSFRQKVMKSVVKKYNDAKESIATRNQE